MFKLVILTDDDPVDSWMAHQIAQQFPTSHSILLDYNGPDPDALPLHQKLLASPLRVISAIPRELICQRTESKREQTMTEQLWGGDQPLLSEALPNVIQIAPEDINSEATAKQLRDLAPDLLLVFGGIILKEFIYSIPRLGSWNLQWGISDRYRGQHGIFFPLALEDFDAIGATLHRIDAGINTGEALLQLRPALGQDDTESSIEIKIARAMVPKLVNLLETIPADMLAEAMQGKAIDPQMGKTIIYRDRTACLEMQYRLKRLLGRFSVPESQEKQNLFLDFPMAPSAV